MRCNRLVAAFAATIALVPPASAAPCAGFTDVSDASGFCASITWMYNRAITLGCGPSVYCPAAFVTREQMAAFMYRLGYQNAFLNGGNAFGNTAVLGTTDANGIAFVVNQAVIGGFNANQFFMGPSTTTGTSAAIEGATYSTSAGAKAVLGIVASSAAGTGSSGVVGVNEAAGSAGQGVKGEHKGSGIGVFGVAPSGTGVFGTSVGGVGVYAESWTGTALYADSAGGRAVEAQSSTMSAVDATSAGVGLANATAVYRNNDTTAGEPGGIALFARNASGDATIVAQNTGAGDAIRVLNSAGNALVFRVSNAGTVRADGSYNCGLAGGCFNAGLGADLAERIDAGETLLPGDVVEIDADSPGHYRRSRAAASPLVAGVVSTTPGITLNNNDLAAASEVRTDLRPLLALAGTVDVRASAENGPIRAGDLLVSAGTEGTAMRADNHAAPGTVIGKALTGLPAGTGRVAMLVMLR